MAVATSIDALATGVILPSAVGAETFNPNDMFHFRHLCHYIYSLSHRRFLGKNSAACCTINPVYYWRNCFNLYWH